LEKIAVAGNSSSPADADETPKAMAMKGRRKNKPVDRANFMGG